MPTPTTPRSASKTVKKKSSGASRAIPAALAARANAAVSAKTSRLRGEAHALLALISRRKREITGTRCTKRGPGEGRMFDACSEA